jgi:predicted small metal-binding protein
MKRLSCRDIGLDCDQVILGDSEEAVIDRAVSMHGKLMP